VNKVITIKDVAAAAGVSPSTVSVILNGCGNKYRIAKSTQVKVLSVAKELKYRTNVYAKKLAMGNATENPIYAFFWSILRLWSVEGFFEGLMRYKDECVPGFEFAIHPI
jgi:DNA-binding LacI/PurR family transcriptional regulator